MTTDKCCWSHGHSPHSTPLAPREWWEIRWIFRWARTSEWNTSRYDRYPLRKSTRKYRYFETYHILWCRWSRTWYHRSRRRQTHRNVWKTCDHPEKLTRSSPHEEEVRWGRGGIFDTTKHSNSPRLQQSKTLDRLLSLTRVVQYHRTSWFMSWVFHQIWWT